MKVKTIFMFLFVISIEVATGCPLCEKQQAKIIRGLIHGTGPQSGWDWIIIALITAIALLVIFFSLKYLTRPGEENTDHIKLSILSN